MGKLRFLVSRRHGNRTDAAACVPDPSPESCRGPLLSRSVTAIPKPGPGGELGAMAGIYPRDGSRRNVPLARRDGHWNTAPCPCRHRVPRLRRCLPRAPSQGQGGHRGAAVLVVGGMGDTGSGSASPCLSLEATVCVLTHLELSVSLVPRSCRVRWMQMPHRGGVRGSAVPWGRPCHLSWEPFVPQFCPLQSCPAVPAHLPWVAIARGVQPSPACQLNLFIT